MTVKNDINLLYDKIKKSNDWLNTKKFKRSGDCAKATKTNNFLKLQLVFLIGIDK